MSEPQIIVGGLEGHHNADLAASAARVERSKAYRDCSTVMVLPTRGTIPARVVESLMGLQVPPNQGFVRLFISGMEVGEAYEHALDLILGNEVLKGFRYLLTVEEDNLIPPDALLRLIQRIDEPYDAVSGLYWTKGEGGVPQIWGDAADVVNFRPQAPRAGQVVECHGIGMGCALFDLDMFRGGRIERPFFKTLQGPGGMMTQDLYFWRKAREKGFRCAVDCDIRVGHLDPQTGMVW